ncbi:hypothetical protein [Streptomyces sp. NRRL S-87]|uniref:hypothetical protein n=1 Tax=Streptomyces sp. NRRL S-87 TaxID=1463920 RepID=UPI0004BF0709|nr:hypothetical protein [Streptomyces sp. NRRL S-87]
MSQTRTRTSPPPWRALLVVLALVLGVPGLLPAAASAASGTRTAADATGRPPTASATLDDPGFDAGAAGWTVWPGGTSNFTTYGPGVVGNDPFEGNGFAATNTSVAGGGFYQDRAAWIPAGTTYCVSAELATQGAAGGARGTLALWFVGSTASESSDKHVTGLGGGNDWTRVDVCHTASSPHTAVRVQFYPEPDSPTMVVDAVDLHRSFVTAAGFNRSAAGWKLFPGTRSNFTTYGDGDTNPAYEGSGYGATNTQDPGGGFYQDVPASAVGGTSGTSMCVSAYVASQGPGGGASGTLAMWFLGSAQPAATKAYGDLPGGNGWTRIQTCGTARGNFSAVRVQFYPTPGTNTTVVDAVDLHRDGITGPGFNPGDPNAWQGGAALLVSRDPSPVPGEFAGAYEGDGYAVLDPTASPGSKYQDVTVNVRAGESYCVDVMVTTYLARGGGRATGTLALWFLGDPGEPSVRPFTAPRAGQPWARLTVCGTALADHRTARVEFYPSGSANLAVDAVDLHGTATTDTGFNRTDTSLSATLKYHDQLQGADRPIRRGRVEVWRFAPHVGPLWTWAMERVLTTDARGRVATSFPFQQSGIVYALRVVAQNPAAAVRPNPRTAGDWIPIGLNLSGTMWREPGDRNPIEYTVRQTAQALDFSWTFAGWSAQHFNITDTLLSARDYAAARRADTDRLTRVDVTWLSYDAIAKAPYYNPVESAIKLPSGAWNGIQVPYDDMILAHEYAHFLEHHLGAFYAMPTVHTGCDGFDAQHAWSEGFADYFAPAVRTAYPAARLTGSGVNPERSPQCPGSAEPGSTLESRVAATLWDLDDAAVGTSADDDPAGGYGPTVFRILDKDLDRAPFPGVARGCPTINGFRSAWQARGLPMATLDAVFALNGIGTGYRPSAGGLYCTSTNG